MSSCCEAPLNDPADFSSVSVLSHSSTTFTPSANPVAAAPPHPPTMQQQYSTPLQPLLPPFLTILPTKPPPMALPLNSPSVKSSPFHLECYQKKTQAPYRTRCPNYHRYYTLPWCSHRRCSRRPSPLGLSTRGKEDRPPPTPLSSVHPIPLPASHGTGDVQVIPHLPHLMSPAPRSSDIISKTLT